MVSTVRSIEDHPDFTKSVDGQSIQDEIPDCPDYLSDKAKKHWHELVPNLGERKLINELDKDVLSIYCTLLVRWLELDKMLDEDGMVQVTQKGYIAETGTFTAWKSVTKPILTYAKQLGLTPPARIAMKQTDAGQLDLLDLT